jgi:adenylosuccinate lyase
LSRLTNVIKNLVIYPDKMKENLDALGGLVFSQQILLLLTQKGFSREKAYEIVQRNAMKVWEAPTSKRSGLFKKLLIQDREIISHISKDEINKQFDYKYHTKNIDTIFKRVFEN